MGRPRLPTKLKLLKGTAQPCRMNKNEPNPEAGMPEPPEHLSERAAKVYPHVAKMLLDMKVLTVSDGMALEGLCQAYCDWRAAVEFLEERGSSVYTTTQTDSAGNERVVMKPYPQVAERNEADRRLRGWLQSFGLTPADRSKVSAIAEPEANPWAEFVVEDR